MKLSNVFRSNSLCLAMVGILLVLTFTDARATNLPPHVPSPLHGYLGPVPATRRATTVDPAMALRAWVECVNRYNARRLHAGIHVASAWRAAQPPLTVFDICGNPPTFPERVVTGSGYGGVPVGRGPWR